MLTVKNYFILWKEIERRNLAERFDIPQLELFSANITLRRRDSVSIVVEGSIEAHIRFGEQLDIEIISNNFDTLLLNNFGKSSSGNFHSGDSFPFFFVY